MSLQVGSLCFADAVAAGQAACSAHVPSVTVAGGNVVQLSCAGVTSSGAMQMQTVVAPVDGSASGVTSTLELTPTFGACMWQDYVDAIYIVIPVALLAWLGWYGIKKINDQLKWGRGTSD